MGTFASTCLAGGAGLLIATGCGSTAAPVEPTPARPADAAISHDAPATPPAPVDAEDLPVHQSHADLAAALRATIPADARVVGFGEIHARVDRPDARSALSQFTTALPAIGDKISDLVVETWLVDPKCGTTAVVATKKIETEVKRPAATKSEIALLADAAKAAGIRPHAMTLACKDYDLFAPKKGPVDPVAMLTLTTKELTRIAQSAITFRDKEPNHRPWIALYGGALHNNRFPDAGIAEWSYAPALDKASRDHFVEIDLIVPEFAEPDAASKTQPWFPLIATAKQVRVWQRGERSFVIVLPRAK